MNRWPETDTERTSAALLRVDLDEARHLAGGAHCRAVDHLLRSAAAACLLDREPDALALVARAARRMVEWVEAVGAGRAPVGSYGELAATRGLLVLALLSEGARAEADATARAFVEQVDGARGGAIGNARLAAALLLGDAAAAQAAARSCDLSDAGLGVPWRRFAAAVDAGDAAQAVRCAQSWLREKTEATHTNEWGSYNEVPIEVSAALALAARRGLAVAFASDRILSALRS